MRRAHFPEGSHHVRQPEDMQRQILGPRHFRTSFLISVTMLLGACGRPIAPSPGSTSLMAQRAAACDAFMDPCADAPPHDPVPVEGAPDEPAVSLDLTLLHTPHTAVAAFMERGGVASIALTGEIPDWSRSLLDGNHLSPDRVNVGEPVEVRSPVDLSMPNGDAGSDVDTAPALQRTLAQVGDAALVPLYLSNGLLAGWVRLPLLPVIPDSDAPRHSAVSLEDVARPRLALLTTPTSAVTASDARQRAGAGESAPVLALATGGGDYRSFDFTYLVQTQHGDTLVSQGQPDLVTDDGRLMPALQAQTLSADALKVVDSAAALSIEQSFVSYRATMEEK